MTKILVRCPRCGVALQPAIHLQSSVVESVDVWLAPDSVDGPCISIVDGSPLLVHPFVQAEVTVGGTPTFE